MTNGFSVGRILGIQVSLDWSLIFIFLLITWNLSSVFANRHPDWATPLSVVVAAVAAVLFLVSVLVHELAHSVVAVRQGVPVRKITLFMFGGVAELEREPPSPRAEFLITIVGPISSFILGGIFLFLGSLVARIDALVSDPAGVISRLDALSTLLLWLGPVNIVLAVFNMLPGFPLDGGRVLRSLLWAVKGNLREATRWATWVGQAVAWLFIIAGVAMVFGATIPFFGRGTLGGLWLAFIGWFLNGAAVQAYRQVATQDRLEGVLVSQMMSREVHSVEAEATVAALVNDRIMSTDEHAFAVMRADRLVGMVCLEDVQKVPRERWESTQVSDIMTPSERLSTLSPSEPVTVALNEFAQRDVNQLPVVQEGRLIGMLRRRDIFKWLQLQGERPAR